MVLLKHQLDYFLPVTGQPFINSVTQATFRTSCALQDVWPLAAFWTLLFSLHGPQKMTTVVLSMAAKLEVLPVAGTKALQVLGKELYSPIFPNPLQSYLPSPCCHT